MEHWLAEPALNLADFLTNQHHSKLNIIMEALIDNLASSLLFLKPFFTIIRFLTAYS